MFRIILAGLATMVILPIAFAEETPLAEPSESHEVATWNFLSSSMRDPALDDPLPNPIDLGSTNGLPPDGAPVELAAAEPATVPEPQTAVIWCCLGLFGMVATLLRRRWALSGR